MIKFPWFGEAPAQATAHLEILQKQDRNQCCPNLNMNRIRTGPHEGFDFQVLFGRLEKQLDLPALLVDGANRARRQFQVVGQENDFHLLSSHPTRPPGAAVASPDGSCRCQGG